MFDSLFDSFLKVYTFEFVTKSSEVPASFPIQLNTSGLDPFFPGLEKHYGPNLPIDIYSTLRKLEKFEVKENDSTMGFTGTLGVEFVVNMANNTHETAVNITLDQLLTNFTVLIGSNNTLTMNVTEVKLGMIEVDGTTFGSLNMTLLTKLLNDGIILGLDFFNIWIQTQTVQIPSELFGLFTLSDLVVKYHDGFLEAGLTPTFLPPTEDVPNIYTKFVPEEYTFPYGESDVFEETIDEMDVYSSSVIRDYYISEIF